MHLNKDLTKVFETAMQAASAALINILSGNGQLNVSSPINNHPGSSSSISVCLLYD